MLDHAPEEPLGHDFSTMTMNIIDKILATLGNSKDGLGKFYKIKDCLSILSSLLNCHLILTDTIKRKRCVSVLGLVLF